MNKPARVAVITFMVVLVGAVGVLFSKYQAAKTGIANLETSAAETRNRYGQAINEIAVIQDSLNAIVLGDEGAHLLSSELEAEQRLRGSGGDEALERIAILKAGIERTKDRIEVLDAELKKSGVKIAGLQRMVNNLKKSVADKEVQVAELVTKVESLETQVTGLTAEVQEGEATITSQGEVIEEKRSALATVYYAVGSKKDLTSAGMVVASGGVLGMGKTLEPSGNLDATMLTPVDTDYQTTIRIPAKKVEILTAQPQTSYQLEVLEEEVLLHITNPEEFRKVKHLLIMTA